MVALLGCYGPLFRREGATGLLGCEWSDELRTVLRRQVEEPLREAVLQEVMPRLTPIGTGVSSAVRAQYEENPFPRWLTLPAIYEPVYLEDLLRGWFPQARGHFPGNSESPEVLVAGCGTGESPITLASQIKGVRVTAVDLSLASLAYGQRKANELGLENISFGQGDIVKLGALERQFDHINCFGVLHHLEDPLVGWRVLAQLLKPGCTMFIGLYSRIARRGAGRCTSTSTTRAMRRPQRISARAGRTCAPCTRHRSCNPSRMAGHSIA